MVVFLNMSICMVQKDYFPFFSFLLHTMKIFGVQFRLNSDTIKNSKIWVMTAVNEPFSKHSSPMSFSFWGTQKYVFFLRIIAQLFSLQCQII